MVHSAVSVENEFFCLAKDEDNYKYEISEIALHCI